MCVDTTSATGVLFFSFFSGYVYARHRRIGYIVENIRTRAHARTHTKRGTEDSVKGRRVPNKILLSKGT